MSEKLLSYAAAILLFATFGYTYVTGTGHRAELSGSAGLSTTLVFARVLPMCIVVLICLASVPIQHYGKLAKTLATPPFFFWSWYAAVALVSGFLSGIVPAWSAWKSTEIFVVMLWGGAISLHLRRAGHPGVLIRTFSVLVFCGYFVSVWSLGELLRQGHSLPSFVFSGNRLHTEWPHVNSITLSVLSMFTILGALTLESKMNFFKRLIFLAPAILVFFLSRSRTGILGLLVVAGISVANRNTVSKGRKTGFLLLGICLFGLLVSSSSLREWMRIESWQEFARGAGRITTEDGRSGWGDTYAKLKDRPAIGRGFLIIRRMLDDDHPAVDNFVLQAIVAAGIVGALPMVLYSFYKFFGWLLPNRYRDRRIKRVAEMGLIATSMGFAKSITTNGMSVYSVSLMLFMFGVMSHQYVSSADEPSN